MLIVVRGRRKLTAEKERNRVPIRKKRHVLDERIPWASGLAVALLALIVLGSTVVVFPVAGVSADLLSQHLWLDAMPVASSPLYGMVARMVDGLVPGTPAAALNLFSLVCGVGAVLLFFQLNARLLQTLCPAQSVGVYVLCGVSAALYLVACVPFWIVCSRAHSLSFQVFLLLLALFLLGEYQRTRRIRMMYVFAFVFGIGLAEYPVFVVLAWPLAMLTLFLMRKRGHLRPSRRKRYLLTGVGWALAGFLLVLIPACWQLIRSPAEVWIQDAGFLRMLRRLLSAELAQALAMVPRTGWILIGMVTLFPWAICVVETRRPAALGHLPSLFLYGGLGVLPLIILFGGPLAPAEVARAGHPLVAPYPFIASTFGLVVNYWRAAVTGLWEKRSWGREWLRNGFIALLPCTLIAGPLVNHAQVSPEPARVLYACA